MFLKSRFTQEVQIEIKSQVPEVGIQVRISISELKVLVKFLNLTPLHLTKTWVFLGLLHGQDNGVNGRWVVSDCKQ